MKYTPQNYAQAFCEELARTASEKQPILVKNFVASIYRNSDFLNLNKILKEISEILAKTKGGRVVDLEFAREVDRLLIEKCQKSFTAKDLVRIKLNPALVAGVRITINGEKEYDNSLTGKLKKVFSHDA